MKKSLRRMAAIAIMLFMMAPVQVFAGPPFVIQDSLGRAVTLNKAVERMVVLGNYRCEAVKVLGCIHKVVGVDGNSAKGSQSYFPELKGQPLVGTWQTPNVEVIASLRPDLVITSANAIRVERLQKSLSTFGIPVAGFDFFPGRHLVPGTCVAFQTPECGSRRGPVPEMEGRLRKPPQAVCRGPD